VGVVLSLPILFEVFFLERLREYSCYFRPARIEFLKSFFRVELEKVCSIEKFRSINLSG
jgi:hypothetical protein